jgi:hypothetical protein
MTATNAATLANLKALRAAAAAALAAMTNASENGTSDEWLAAWKASKPVCAAAQAEEARIVAQGFGGDSEFEWAVLGRLTRRYEYAA